MKKFMLIFLGLMIASACYAANTYTFFKTGTATAAASTTITITTPSGGPYMSSGIVFSNDGTNEVFVDFTGQLTNETQMTAESRAITFKVGDPIYADSEFRTSKIKVRGNGGPSAYRFWAVF